jgi:hypothetical protein
VQKRPALHFETAAELTPGSQTLVDVIGSIRRERLDHINVFHEAQLRRILKDYFEVLWFAISNERRRSSIALSTSDACLK